MSIYPSLLRKRPRVWAAECFIAANFSVIPSAKNQLSSLNYDAAGNVTSVSGVPGVTYTYDAENHLTSAGTVNYTYDGDGKRVIKSSGTMYWYGTSSAPQMETDLSNTGVASYYYFNGELFLRYIPAPYGQFDTYFNDHLGNARAVYTWPSFAITDYYPFGGERDSGTAGVVNNYRFTGKERDSESGLDNFGARYFLSSRGRFMSPDPMGGTLNRYVYVRNNPLNLTDPTGLDSYLACTSSDHKGCTQVQSDPNNKNQTWVQADKNGNATIITSDSIRAGDNNRERGHDQR